MPTIVMMTPTQFKVISDEPKGRMVRAEMPSYDNALEQGDITPWRNTPLTITDEQRAAATRPRIAAGTPLYTDGTNPVGGPPVASAPLNISRGGSLPPSISAEYEKQRYGPPVAPPSLDWGADYLQRGASRPAPSPLPRSSSVQPSLPMQMKRIPSPAMSEYSEQGFSGLVPSPLEHQAAPIYMPIGIQGMPMPPLPINTSTENLTPEEMYRLYGDYGIVPSVKPGWR